MISECPVLAPPNHIPSLNPPCYYPSRFPQHTIVNHGILRQAYYILSHQFVLSYSTRGLLVLLSCLLVHCLVCIMASIHDPATKTTKIIQTNCAPLINASRCAFHHAISNGTQCRVFTLILNRNPFVESSTKKIVIQSLTSSQTFGKI